MRKKLIYTSLLIVLLSLGWFKLDKDLYFMGKSLIRYENVLPLDVYPTFRYSFEGGFYLSDPYGMPIISQGTKFLKNEKEVEKIIEYGVSVDQIIIKVKTIGDDIQYLEIENDSLNRICEDCFSFNVINMNQNFINNYQWYKIPADKLPLKEFIRNIISLLLLCSSMFLLYVIIHYIISNVSKR